MHFRKSLPCYGELHCVGHDCHGDLHCVGYIWWTLFGFVYIGSYGLCSFLNFIFCEGPILMSAMSMSYSLRVFLSSYVALFLLLKLFVYMFLGTLVPTPYMVLHIYGRLVIVVMLSLIDFVEYFSWFSACVIKIYYGKCRYLKLYRKLDCLTY